MALNTKPRGRWWSRLHFLIRFAGLTGLPIAGVGLFLAYLDQLLSWDALRSAVEGLSSKTVPDLALALLLGGGVLVVLALLVEVIAAARLVAGRRSAFGTNVVLQLALAVVLLVGVNLYSTGCNLDWLGLDFRSDPHYVRADWTSPDPTTGQKKFTLPEDVRNQLAQLQGKTSMVVYLNHQTLGRLSDKPDTFDFAAERKVIGKVRDLVDQFRELGPQFDVTVLDVEAENYQDQLKAVTEKGEPLRQAIDNAPENSIFFYASHGGKDKVQRLSFNDIYQLDKTSSQQAGTKRGNLVLLYQGVQPFANKVLNARERRPRVAIAVNHDYLTSQGPMEEYTLAGLRSALVARGFDVKDIVLKRFSQFRGPEPVVYTYDETRYEKLQERLAVLAIQLRFCEVQLEAWKTMSAAKLASQGLTDKDREEQIRGWNSRVAILTKLRQADQGEQNDLRVESLQDQKRLTDVKAKLERALADCDLLIIPRVSLQNVTGAFNVPYEFHNLDQPQADAIKDFIKAGKPVLACFGVPVNDPPDPDEERPAPVLPRPDAVEQMLEQLGFRLGSEAVLFDNEIGSLAEYQASLLVEAAQDRRRFGKLGEDVKVPPVGFGSASTASEQALAALVASLSGSPLGDGPLLAASAGFADQVKPRSNPLRGSLRLTVRSVGKDQILDLRLRHPRPITYQPPDGRLLAVEPYFMWTDPDSWEEARPFVTATYLPRYEQGRRGPSSIGAAVEVPLPTEWFSAGELRPADATVRIAAIGNGSLFLGHKLSPAREKLLLDVCNWLLKRDDRLTQGNAPWQYPRVNLSEREQTLWQSAAVFGLPLLCAYLGMVVLLVRRLR